MSIQGMHANQLLADNLRAIADSIETQACVLPEPDRTRLILEFDDADRAAVWARTQLGCGISGDDRGNASAEKWISSVFAVSIHAPGGGTL